MEAYLIVNMTSYKQVSFAGGMNLLLDDSRLPVSFRYKEGDIPYDITYNQYRLGINCRTRFDIVQPIPSSVVDETAPSGIKQGLITFGNYLILFAAGKAYYKLITLSQPQWNPMPRFSMNSAAPRYWTCQVPQNTTLYGRLAGVGSYAVPDSNPVTTLSFANGQLPIQQVSLADAQTSFGTAAGIVVQDGITQPWFIYIDQNGMLTSRQTQNYDQWSFPIDPTTLDMTGPDDREYVPVGTYMSWYNGILFIVDPTYTYIYRSVSGRPLDFVVAVDENGQKAGDAAYTSYSVGVAGITAMAAVGQSLFVAAGGASTYLITVNQTPNAPQIFGEYLFNRQVLFNANCVTEQGIITISGGLNNTGSPDTLFIDANGLRSFNAVETLQNEGRNSVFSATIQSLFQGITQTAVQNGLSSPVGWCSAINFNDYAIFSVNTIYGYVLVIYDTINNVFQAIDKVQLGNHAVKQFASINVTELSLWAITDDDRVVNLYAGEEFDQPWVRFGAVASQDPKKELKVVDFRAIFENITEDITVTAYLFTNNRFNKKRTFTLKYVKPVTTYDGESVGPDVGTQTNSIRFPFPESTTGWKSFIVLTWNTGASLNSVSIDTSDSTPVQPIATQQVAG